MKVYITEWPNKTATILTENGEVIWSFSSVPEARQACDEWCSIIYVGKDDCLENPDKSPQNPPGGPTLHSPVALA